MTHNIDAWDVPTNNALGVPKPWEYPNSLMLCNGKSENKPDDLGVPLWIGHLHMAKQINRVIIDNHSGLLRPTVDK